MIQFPTCTAPCTWHGTAQPSVRLSSTQLEQQEPGTRSCPAPLTQNAHFVAAICEHFSKVPTVPSAQALHSHLPCVESPCCAGLSCPIPPHHPHPFSLLFPQLQRQRRQDPKVLLFMHLRAEATAAPPGVAHPRFFSGGRPAIVGVESLSAANYGAPKLP